MLRSELITKIKKISRILRVSYPNLRQSTKVLTQWYAKTRKPSSYLLRKGRISLNNLNSLLHDKNFIEIFENVKKGITYSRSQALKIYNAMTSGDKYLMNIGGVIFTVSPNNKTDIIQILTNGFRETEDNIFGSDTIHRASYNDLNTLTIEKVEPRNVISNNGGFFPRLNNTNIDLSRYQIFNKAQASENCLIHSLSLYNTIPIELINKVKLSIQSGVYIAKKNLHIIADLIKTSIFLHRYESKTDSLRETVFKYGKYKDSIHLSIYQNHYFIYEKTKYSRYSIMHYKDVCEKQDYHNIININHRSQSRFKINSLQMIHHLFRQNLLIKGDMSLAPETHNHIDLKNDIYLNNIKEEQREIVIPEYKENKADIWYADFESITTGDVHKLYLLGYVSRDDDYVKILNVCDYKEPQYLIYNFLKDITKAGTRPACVYFHNLKYDLSLMEKYLNITSICSKDNQVYNAVCFYKNKRIEFRDSYKLANMRLSDFAKNFNLPQHLHKLEAINYTYYTFENNNKFIPTYKYTESFNAKNKKIFYDTVKESIFNPTEYYINYLKMDCLVLKHGMETFEKIIKTIDVRLSIYSSLTISSLTDKYMMINKAYEGVYENTANLRNYISHAIYGGRVHCNEKYIKQEISTPIQDFDGVSLYPSAINRLCREMGLPKGPAIRYVADRRFEYAIFTVEILEVNKDQQMPFIALKTDSSIDYTNNITPGTIVIIDSITLEDYKNFHKIKFRIIDGIMWNNGYNKNMGALVQRLFDTRMKNKEKNPALGNILKLMLNSAYGKCAIKSSNTRHSIIKKDVKKLTEVIDPITMEITKVWETIPDRNMNNIIYKNFNTIKSIRKINDNIFEVENIIVDNSYNRGHIAAIILSTSKRIMNEVFDVANTNKLPIYYCDTDSLHMNLSDVDILADKYNAKYKKILIGKNMEQFHGDFKLKKAIRDIHAVKSIFLGKKSYMDCLVGLDKDDNIITGEHIRLKGITKVSIQHHTKDLTNGAIDLFRHLMNNNTQKMILNPPNPKNKIMFEYINGDVRTRPVNNFTRDISF